VAGSTGTVPLSTATLPCPFTGPLPVPLVLRSGQKADDGYPEDEALPLPKRQRHVPPHDLRPGHSLRILNASNVRDTVSRSTRRHPEPDPPGTQRE